MKKKIAIGVCAVLALLLLIPIPMHLKDGGTRVYQAVLYRVENVHRIAPYYEGRIEYLTGTVVKILGIEVFNNVKASEPDSEDPVTICVTPLPPDHTHLPAETDSTLEHEPVGYCGNTLTTVTHGGLLPEEVSWSVTFMGSDSVALTDLLLYLDYSGDICKCLPEYTVDTEFGKGYGISLSESYARYEDGQASLTTEQVAQILEIIERQKEQA